MATLQSVTDLGWASYLGKTDTLISMTLLGRTPVKVQDFWQPAVEAMEQALVDTGYENPCDYIGSYKKREIAGTDFWSWHSYGAAIDLDYGGNNPESPDHPGIDRNPHLHEAVAPGFGTDTRFQITEAQVNAVESITTGNGNPVWRWLGWSIGDTMHFEPACTPDDARTGITYNPDGETEMTLDRWVTRLRDIDIDRMVEINILTVAEGQYFRPMLLDVLSGQHDVAYAEPDWQNLRDAVAVRSELWV